MSLIMRGLGPDPRLVTSGFGPTAAAIVKTAIPDIAGRSSKRYYDLDALKKEAENPVRTYVITAGLKSVNGVMTNMPENKMIAHIVDDNIEVKILKPPRIIKTKPAKGIFIKVHEVFKGNS